LRAPQMGTTTVPERGALERRLSGSRRVQPGGRTAESGSVVVTE
jgi:hypothetical protein